MNDWTGNAKSIFTCNGASNHSEGERQHHDYYATEPKAVELLLERECFSPYVWECACGEGHMSEVLKVHGYKVKSSDLYDRGYEETEIIDFLTVKKEDIKRDASRDIITNPPYKYAKEFVEKALEISMNGSKVAMLLKLTFLEGKNRRHLFENHAPKIIYVFGERIDCWKNGIKPDKPLKTVCYAWFIWEKGYKGATIIKRID